MEILGAVSVMSLNLFKIKPRTLLSISKTQSRSSVKLFSDDKITNSWLAFPSILKWEVVMFKEVFGSE